ILTGIEGLVQFHRSSAVTSFARKIFLRAVGIRHLYNVHLFRSPFTGHSPAEKTLGSVRHFAKNFSRKFQGRTSAWPIAHLDESPSLRFPAHPSGFSGLLVSGTRRTNASNTHPIMKQHSAINGLPRRKFLQRTAAG